MSFFFGDFELDAVTYKLLQADSEVPLQPKVFDAIRYLLENHDRVVLKKELLEALWLGEHVSDSAVPWTIHQARKALGQDADANHPIETVRGRGYRFVGAVRRGGASARPPDSTAALGLASESLRSRPQSDPFVGRTDAMGRLLGALHEANSGRGRLCLLTGEAGIGKTRCIAEFALMARRLKVSVWTGRCLEGGRTAAFWPWVQVLRDAIGEGSMGPGAKREFQKLLLELTSSDASVADMDASSAVAARFWVLEKLSRVPLSAEMAPRVVLLDDMQWADEGSLDLLVFLSAELSRAPLLVVATARDPPPPGCEAWAKALGRLGPCERIDLVGLRFADVEQYVTEVTGLELTPEIHRTVYTKCGGNPLFLQETVRLLAAMSESRGLRSLRSDDISVAGVARDVLRYRLTGLPVVTCEALEVACVVGQEFDLPVLLSALGVEAEALLVGLDEAERARLIAPRHRPGTYAFTHDALREALYEGLSTARRVELHDRVARALEERSGGGFRLNDLAYHCYRALPRVAPSVVERYARMAGEAAMRGFAYEDAARFFGWALEARRFLAHADARSHCELLLALAAASRLSGRVRDSRKAVETAIDIARENGFADLLFEAARSLRPSSTIALVPDPVSRQALEDASRLLSEDQRSLRIRVLGQLASVPPYSLSIEKSHELSARAVALAREGTDDQDVIDALKGRLHTLSGPDHIDELIEVTDELLSLDGYLTSLHRGEAEAARYRAFLLKGDIPAAVRTLDELGRLGRVLRRPESLWHYDRECAQLAFLNGDFEGAQTKFQELSVRSRQLRLPYGKFFFIMHVLLLAYERTSVSSLQSSAREWRSAFSWATALPSFRAHELRLTLAVGNVDEARRTFNAIAHAGFQDVTRELGYLSTLAQLSLVAVALEDRDRGAILYDLMKPYPHHNTPTNLSIYHGSVSYFLGQLARLFGRTGDAVGHLEDALEMNASMGFVQQVARTQLALAEALSEEGGKGRRLRATDLVAEAHTTAQRLEMRPLLAEIGSFLGRESPSASRLQAR